jgi:hypothetical protein
MNKGEHLLQIAICRYLDYQHYTYFAIPNGGLRSKAVARALKAEGVKAGVADIFICRQSSMFNGLFIEVKFGNNKQTEKQIEFQDKVTNEGYLYRVVRSISDLIELLEFYKNN